MPTERVSFDEDDGPISIDITSGYATLGQYQLLYEEDGTYVPFAKDRPKRLDDEVPDCIVIPVPESQMNDQLVVVRGNYKPAPGHEQVQVTYTFVQESTPIHEHTIQETATDAPYLRFSHRFFFAAASS